MAALPKRRMTIIWLLFGSVLICSWCSLLSGVGGWLLGYDLGQRETRAGLLPEVGVLIVRVERDSPADQGGLARGDTITAINGVVVADVPALRDELLGYAPGDVVKVTYRDDLGERAASVTLGRFPEENRPYLGIYYTARAESPSDL